MINEEEKRKAIRLSQQIDQDFQPFLDNIPALLSNLFRRLKKEGFNENQALELVKQYMDTALIIANYDKPNTEEDL